LERDQSPSGAFVFKARFHCQANSIFQVWIKQSANGVRYAYHLFSGSKTLLRWDNAPHFPMLKNYPHHFHDTRGDSKPSGLVGEPIQDLSFVLSEVEKYFETQT
jgi:hypothetical protein